MATAKYKSPHDRALIAFGSDVLAILEDWDSELTQSPRQALQDSADNLGLATVDINSQFRAIPRARFRNRLGL